MILDHIMLIAFFFIVEYHNIDHDDYSGIY